MSKVKNLVLAAMLTAVSIIIPIAFTGLKLVIGPYTATLASHVPVILAMFISPFVAVIVAIGSFLGFLIAVPNPIVAFRALTHTIFALVGAYMLMKRYNVILTLGITGILHSIAESLVVLLALNGGWQEPTPGYANTVLILLTAGGTFIHHCIDSAIALAVYKPLKSSKVVELVPLNFRALKQ